MTKNEQNRLVAWRLKLLREADEYESHEEAGLCDRARTPLHCPRAPSRSVWRARQRIES